MFAFSICGGSGKISASYYFNNYFEECFPRYTLINYNTRGGTEHVSVNDNSDLMIVEGSVKIKNRLGRIVDRDYTLKIEQQGDYVRFKFRKETAVAYEKCIRQEEFKGG